MSRNIGWVMRQREDARVIVINHIIHTKTESMYQGETWGHFTPMGALVKQDLDKCLYSIGLAYSDGDFWDDWQELEGRNRKTVAPPAPDGIEQKLGAVMNGDFSWTTPQEPHLLPSAKKRGQGDIEKNLPDIPQRGGLKR